MNSLLEFGSQVSLQLRRLLFVHVHVGVALDLSVLVGGDAPVLTRVGLGHFFDLQLGLLAFLLDGDPAAVRELPPLPLHPLDAGDGVTAHLSDEGGGSLCGAAAGGLGQKQQGVQSNVWWCERLTLCDVRSFGLLDEEQVVQFFGRSSRWSFSRWSCSWFLCNRTTRTSCLRSVTRPDLTTG